MKSILKRDWKKLRAMNIGEESEVVNLECSDFAKFLLGIPLHRVVSAILMVLLAFGCGSTKPELQKMAKADETPAPAAAPAPVLTPTPDFSDPAYRWDLTSLYASDEAFNKALKDVQAQLPEIEGFAGTLGKNASSLLKALDSVFAVQKEGYRLYTYANGRFNQDTRNAKGLEMRQSAMQLFGEYTQKVAFFEPELLEIGQKKIDAFIKKEKQLEKYRHYLHNILRQKTHMLDKKGEEILAATNMMAGTPFTLYDTFTNAEIPWSTVTLSDGTEVRVDHAAFFKLRAAPNREDRVKVFQAFWKKWAEYEQTLGAMLDAQLKQDLFNAKVRNYTTCLAASLDAKNVPSEVLHTLVATANDNLDTLHRFLKLQKRILGVDELRYHDTYAPLAKSIETHIPLEQGKQLILESLTPLGEDYVSTLRSGFENRWMDVYPREGKAPGAYATDAYDVHPYVLMNYNNDFDSVSTVAHEFGHAMHSYYANKTQPFSMTQYSGFIAEVPAIFNQNLLLDKLSKDAKTDDEKLFYLGAALDHMRTAFFRPVMMTEFELKIHELVEKGESLTGERFTEIYKELVRRYRGHRQGVMIVDDIYAIEWAYIPHFYSSYYMYEYATSLAASSQFVKEVLEGKEGAREKYLGMLKAGGSQYPYEILKAAGVDLATPAPYLALIDRMNDIMDQLEQILNSQ